MGGRLSVSVFSFGEKCGEVWKRYIRPSSALPASFAVRCSSVPCALWSLGTSLVDWPKSSPSFPSALHVSWKGLQKGGEPCAQAIAGHESSSPRLRSKRHNDDYQTPFPPSFQLDPVIWELMLRSQKLAFIISLTAENLLSPAPTIFGLFVGWIRTALLHFPQQRVFLTDPTHVPVADRKSFSKAICFILNLSHQWHWEAFTHRDPGGCRKSGMTLTGRKCRGKGRRRGTWGRVKASPLEKDHVRMLCGDGKRGLRRPKHKVFSFSRWVSVPHMGSLVLLLAGRNQLGCPTQRLCLRNRAREVCWWLCQAADAKRWGHGRALLYLPAATCRLLRPRSPHAVRSLGWQTLLSLPRKPPFPSGILVSVPMAWLTPMSQAAPHLSSLEHSAAQVGAARVSGACPLLILPPLPHELHSHAASL